MRQDIPPGQKQAYTAAFSALFSRFTAPLMDYTLLTSITCTAYTGFAAVMAAGRYRARALDRAPAAGTGHVSVLVPYRNEAHRLDALIRSVKRVSAETGWEFIFIDDHSDDHSGEILYAAFADAAQVRLLRLPPGRSGKKAALAYGVNHAVHADIIATDADCTLHIPALTAMRDRLQIPGIRMVCGPVVQYSGEGFGAGLADLEFLSLVASGISFWGLGMPFMANGAFLGFKKSAFVEVGGFAGNEAFPGGDDVFLLQKMTARYGNGAIRFMTGKEGAVHTAGDTGLREFISRRTRWGAKASAYRRPAPALATLFVFAVCSLYAFTFLATALTGRGSLLLYAAAGKLGADVLLLAPVCARLRRRDLWPYILPASLLHPFYILFTGLWAAGGKYAWKKRNYGRR